MKARLSLLVLVLLLSTLIAPAKAAPRLRSTWKIKHGAVTALSFRADGRQLAIGTEGGRARIKALSGDDVADHSLPDTAGWLSYSPLVYNGHPSGPSTGVGSLVAISPRGRFEVFFTNDYEAQTAGEMGPDPSDQAPVATLSADGRYLAMSSGGPDIWIGRPPQGKRRWFQTPDTDWTGTRMPRPEGVVGTVASLSLNRDGSRLAAAYHSPNGQGALVLFNRRTGGALIVAQVAFPPTAVAFDPKGVHLAAVGSGMVWLGAANGENGTVLPAPPSPARCVAFSPNEQWLAAACADGTVYLWDAKADRLVGELKAHDGAVTSLAWSPDGRAFATGGHDGVVKIWDIDKP